MSRRVRLVLAAIALLFVLFLFSRGFLFMFRAVRWAAVAAAAFGIAWIISEAVRDGLKRRKAKMKGSSGLVAITVAAAGIVSQGCLTHESVDAGEILVVQDPIDGGLHVYSEPGIKPQWFGTTTVYPRSFQYWFSDKDNEGPDDEESIRIRFNEGGHANLSGSVRVDMPLDEAKVVDLHKTYRSAAAVRHELIRPVIARAVYMTGPLLSSKESYAEKRNEMIRYVEDQAANGVYDTDTRDIKTKDAITGEEKTASIVEIVKGADGLPVRVEESAIRRFGIRLYNLAVTEVKYEQTVEAQIVVQQKAVMEVQTAMAEAKKSEQRRITTEQTGMAEAAKAKWDQEVIKAREVTAAQQRLEVARLDKDAAEQMKQKDILLGQGEGERRRLIMAADGALEKKIEAWIKVNEMYADAISKYTGSWVPSVVMGNSGGTGGPGGGANALVELLTAKTARELGLDASMRAGGK